MFLNSSLETYAENEHKQSARDLLPPGKRDRPSESLMDVEDDERTDQSVDCFFDIFTAKGRGPDCQKRPIMNRSFFY